MSQNNAQANPTPTTHTITSTKPKKDVPWNVIVLDDPVNLMGYVTLVFKRVFGYTEERSATLMLEVHNSGRSVVWSGSREKAEFYVQQLHTWQLRTTMEKKQ
ncbi:MAG: ATP-dependent Clp protease adapter ClpS [Akkermansiaceae bacterium]